MMLRLFFCGGIREIGMAQSRSARSVRPSLSPWAMAASMIFQNCLF